MLNRGNSAAGSYAAELAGATGVTLEDLAVTGGQVGIYADAGSGSTGLTVSDCTIYDNQQAGIDLETSNDQATLTGNTLYGTGSGGQSTGIVAVDVASMLFTANTLHDCAIGIQASGSGTISGNTVYAASNIGIYVFSTGLVISANTVFGSSTGIFTSDNYSYYATASTLVTANTIHDNTVGIELQYGAAAASNVVYLNGTGILVGYGASTVSDNRVYANSGTGIFVQTGGCTVTGNTLYSNATGILDQPYYEYSTAVTISNNLVYANSNLGVGLVRAFNTSIVNNTVYQLVGDAVQVNGGSQSTELRNNILWTQAGYDIDVAADSEQGFDSDYNDLYATANGELGQWASFDFTNLADWYYELGLDGHSLTADPQFINPAGLTASWAIACPRWARRRLSRPAIPASARRVRGPRPAAV